MSRIVILHGSTDLYGASRVLLGDVEALVGSGRDVVVALPHDGSLRQRLEHVGAAVRTVKDLAVLRRVSLKRALYVPTRFPVDLRSDDVVVLWTLALLPYLPLLVVRRRPVIVSVHEILEDPLGRALARIVGRTRWPVMVNSMATEQWLIDNGVAPQRLVLAYPATPERRLAPRGRVGTGARVVILGRLNGFKGQADVIDALDKLRGEGISISLDIAGGPFPGQEHHAEHVVRLAEERPWVRFLGELDNVDSVIDQSDVLILATRRPEPFGIVALEAWARGRRCIAPFEGGAAEAAALVDGITFEPRNVDSLSRAIKHAVLSERLLEPPSDRAPVISTCTQDERLHAWETLLSCTRVHAPVGRVARLMRS